jgi:hypothetical protein
VWGNVSTIAEKEEKNLTEHQQKPSKKLEDLHKKKGEMCSLLSCKNMTEERVEGKKERMEGRKEGGKEGRKEWAKKGRRKNSGREMK